MAKSLMYSCIFTVFLLLCGCAMFTAWQAIPPPGGCEQCHAVPINSNWKMVYRAPILHDERNRDYFQTTEYNMPKADQPASSLELRKVNDLKCFDCHKSPDEAHKGRKGSYHHR